LGEILDSSAIADYVLNCRFSGSIPVYSFTDVSRRIPCMGESKDGWGRGKSFVPVVTMF
jgi:hypothetical protein